MADRELDPKYEWQENAANFVLRVHLSGFRKEDFRVQVDGAGRLTVRGQRFDAGGKNIRLHRVFQLPPATILDDITGRFDAGVLSITVPKRPAAPTTTTRVDGITTKEEEEQKKKKAPQPQVDDAKKAANAEPQQQPTKEDARKKKDAVEKKIKEEEVEANNKAAPEKKIKEEELDANNKAAAEKKTKEEEAEANNKAAAQKKIKEEEAEAKKKAAAEEKMKEEEEAKRNQEQKTAVRKVEGPTKPLQRQAAEEAARHHNKCSGWKQRVAEELQGLKGSEWLETVKKNKEVIAAAVTAFSLGLFVATRLSSRN